VHGVKEESARDAAALIRRCRVAALATLRDGAPSASMVPYALTLDPFAVIVLVSELAAHTGEMRADPRVALLISEPESDARPHELARVSIQGTAAPLPPDDAHSAAARAAYLARFPDVSGLFDLGDFRLFSIVPATVRVVAGFARAASIAPALLAQSLAE
jgi:putative heme iron utilization protein